MLFRDLKIWIKYPLFIVALAMFAALATGIIAYTHSAREMQAAAGLKMLALLESRRAALESYFTTISEELHFQAESPLVIDALREFRRAWDQLGGAQTERLQGLYITDNPHPTGQKEKLDSALDGSDYSIAHMKYHPVFRGFLQVRGYYDIFLFDPDGNLVYTVFKELDYATNMMSGPWKDTDLGKIFRAAQAATKKGSLAFSDFQPYAPSNGAPASFISTPVFDEVGALIGVLAFQMPIGRLNGVMQVTAGMGETGETYVVGQDLLMRSDSRFSEESTILKTFVNTVTARKALNGETGVEVTPDYRGVPVLSAYGPCDFLGTRWAVMAEVDEEEVLAPVYEMRKFLLINGAVLTVLIAIVGFFISLNLSRPIVAMTAAMVRLARRDLEVEIPSLNKRDEIGKMARALRVFQINAARRKRTELKNRRLRRGLEATGIGTYFWNVVEDTLEWDDCSLAIYGLKRDQFSGYISDWENALHPGDREKTLNFLDEQNAEQTTEWDTEYRIVRPSGEVRYIYAEGFLERDDKGDLLYVSGIHRDVTERRMEEEKIRRSEEFLQTLLDTSPVPIYIVSKDEGRFLMANAAVGELHKLPVVDLFEHSAKEMYIGAEGAELRAQLVRQLEETGRLDAFDLEVQRIGTGEPCWISVSARLIDYKGKEAFLSVTQDITERKEAEQAIEQANERLEFAEARQRAILESMVDAVITIDETGIVQSFSHAAEEIFGFAADEVIGQNVKMLMPGDIAAEHDGYLQRYVDTGEAHIIGMGREVEAQRQDGSVFPVRLAVAELLSQGERIYVGLMRDITQRKAAEEEIRRSEEFLQTLLDTSPIAITISSMEDGRFLRVNPAVEEAMKLSQKELLNHSTYEIYRNPDDVTEIMRRFGEDGRVNDFDIPALRIGTGEKCWLSLSATAIDYEGGKAVLTVANDITARKEAEESLKHQSALVDLLRQTASDANEATNFKQGAGVCLKSINAYTGWPVGHVYLLSEEDDNLLVPSHIWHIENKKRFSAIVETSEKTTFKRGVGLPGRVLESGEPAWIEDVTVDPNFPRARRVDDIGVKGAFAFPVLAASKVVAVFEFFDEEPSEPDKLLLQTVTHIGSQLGRLYERERAATSLREARDAAQEAEAEIRRSEEQISSIFGTAIDGILSLDSQGHIIASNEALSKLVGYSEEELIGKFVGLIVPEHIQDATAKGINRVFGGNIENLLDQVSEGRLLSKDGTVIPIDFSLAKWETADRTFYTCIIRDVTEKKRQEARINSIFETARDGIIMVDQDGIIHEFSPGCAAMFQRDADEVIGQSIKILIDEDNEHLLDLFVKRFLRSGESTAIGRAREVPARRKDGTNFPTEISVSKSITGGQTGFTGIIRDVTEKRHQENELRLARDVAEEATRAKDTFLATMSHEIRTPMNGVVGMIELLQTTSLADDQRRMLETAKDSSFTLLTIINDILDFSKIEAGKMEIENFAFDLRKAADAVGEMLGGVMAAEKGLPLIVHIQPDVPSILIGDQVRIRQILFNLAGNAIKFTEHGEVHVGIRLAKTLKDGSVDLVYEITDSGIGMTEEQVSRLFKPFEQAKASTTRQYGGTGLGLSIVARLVELMGGTIEVESKPGKGSTFRVSLRHRVPKVKAVKVAGVDLGRIRMLALSKAGSRMNLLAQLLKENDEGLIDLVAPATKRAALIKKLVAAEKAGDPYALVYLSVDVGTGEQDQLRRTIETGKELEKTPRFVVERQNTPIAQDIPGSVLIPPTPYTQTNLVRALAIVLGKASPDIISRAEMEGRAAEVPTIEEAAAAGTLILVAEDNKTNQDVIGRQLAVFGYAHEIADDGEIAFRMLSERTYGLLLCDVHMPNMDGYKLTRTIRANEKKSGTRLPIVAVTANVLQGEADRCLKVGMDDYLAKPVRMKELQACLKKWVPFKAKEETREPPSEADTKAVPPANEGADDLVVEPEVLIEMFGNDDELVNSILLEFLPVAMACIEELDSAHGAKDWAGVGDAGHKLKSSARTIGANRLADLCDELEKAGKAGDDKTINELVPKLRPVMEAVEAYILGRTGA